jgi:hypothetical protein
MINSPTEDPKTLTTVTGSRVASWRWRGPTRDWAKLVEAAREDLSSQNVLRYATLNIVLQVV